MTTARKHSMNPDEVETHHVWSRCVGREYLFGLDRRTGIDYSYRLEWLESNGEYLASVFAVEIGSEALVSNHHHHNLRNRPDIAATWTAEDVCWRWLRAWPRFEQGRWVRNPTDKEIKKLLQRGREEENFIADRRRALGSISTFMARYKHPIAVLVNQEMDRRGHVYEGRFGSRPLETQDEALKCHLYCDLQHVRAGLADSVEESDYNSIQKHIRAAAVEAFRAAHRRAPDEERDGEELEGLEAMLANCYLAPITAGGPLLTVKEQNPPASELVLPAGYLFEQKQAARSESESELESESSAGGEAASGKRSKARGGRGRGKGRRPRPAPRRIHNRLLKKQRRRASRCSILDIPWEQYYELVKRLEKLALQARVCPPPPPPQDGPPAVPRDTQTTTVMQHGMRAFSDWVDSVASQLPPALRKLLQPRPRGDPEEPPE